MMKLPSFARMLPPALTAIILLAFMTGFVIRQNEQAVVTRFGKPVSVISAPGLYLKWPWPVESVNRVDARLNFHEARLSEALTRDRRNVVVPVFVGWRVADPLKFLEAMGNAENARGKLDSLVSSAKNTVLGTCEFKELISAEPRDQPALEEIEAKILAIVAPQAASAFGIRVEQIGIERIMLPEANTSYVFERMRAERSQFAERYLAEGRQEADAIRAKTNAQRTTILADAQRDAEIKRGEGEAEATRIYSQSHSRNAELYLFLRRIDTLKKSINQNTTLILDTTRPPFDLLTQPNPADEAKKN
ncbi:MAG: protease modulator HflC [Chthoniobacteraceae bacterium]